MTRKLYLIPAPLGENALHSLPQNVIDLIHQLDVFIVERAKTARRFIKSTEPSKPISEYQVFELDKHRKESDRAIFMEAIELGKDIGFLAEAGCPGVADPGATIAQIAHDKGIQVIPLVGPSSILLALMASGMNGQSFAFQGYLPAAKPDLAKELKRLEQISGRFKQTQIFIETPYRNNAVIEQAIASLHSNTRFCIAVDLTLPTEYVASHRIKNWKKKGVPDIHKRPAIFLIQG